MPVIGMKRTDAAIVPDAHRRRPLPADILTDNLVATDASVSERCTRPSGTDASDPDEQPHTNESFLVPYQISVLGDH
jgi:hypothetical protein